MSRLLDWFFYRRAEDFLWRGRRPHLKGDYERAIALYTKAIEKDPTYGYAWDARGNAYDALCDMQRAVHDYERASQLLPEEAGIVGNFGRALSLTGRNAEALDVLHRAIALDPTHANNHSFLGFAHAKAGDHISAVQSYTKGIDLPPGDKDIVAWLLTQRAASKRELGAHADALADITRIIETGPASSYTHQEGASIHHALRQYDQALAHIDAAIKLDATAAYPWSLRGYVHESMGDDAAAITAFDRALELDPELVEAYRGRAHVREKLGLRQESIADLTKAIALAPSHIDSYWARGNRHIAANDPADAGADFAKVIELDPAKSVGFYGRGLCMALQKQGDHGIADFTKVMALSPERIEAVLARGNVYLRQEDYTRAATDFTEAIARDPTSFAAVLNRAICYERADRIEHVQDGYKRVLEMLPEPFKSSEFNNRAWANFRLGKLDEALPDADRAIALEPDYAYGHGTRGHILEALKRYPEAIVSFQMALTKTPDAFVETKAREALARMGAGSL